ncbi:ABC transporter substrate-binding protein [Paenibacillus chartarius]|uniref:ABC transporter substrate-binding protein n=1 Tax=Paenibacillus chartarius TaxID=747481 RepID=A0ABV6DN31_9BACL
MKMSKGWSIAASVLLTATVLAGCGGGGGTNTGSGTAGNAPAGNAGTNPASQKAVKLKFWGGVPAEAGPQAVVDAWNAKNPDIQVEYVRFVNDDNGNLKLDTALMAGQDADLYVNYQLSRLKKRADAGLAVDLGTFKDYNIDEKMGPDAKQWLVNDKYYGMPTKKNMSFVWLNKDMLDAAGLPLPPLDWSWEELQVYSAKLKKDKVWGTVIHEAANTTQFDGTIASLGAVKSDGTSNFNNPLWQQGFEIWHTMMHKDKTTPTYGEQFTSKMSVDTMFLKGEAAMLGAGEFVFRNANNTKDFPRSFKIAFATWPKISKDQKDFKYPGGLGDVISINAKSANKEAAWKFLKWYADGGMLPMASGGRIPSSKEVNSDEAIKLMLQGVENMYDQESLKKVVFGNFPTYQLDIDQQVLDARKEEFEKYFLNKQDIAATLKNMEKRHNDFIKQSKK